MAVEDQNFDLSGPRGLTRIDWKNADHVRLVIACLVQGVSVLERDRQGKREGSQALAPRWWETFGFQLMRTLVDEGKSSIFGAIFEYNSPPFSCNHSADGPRFVIAFRGTLIKDESVLGDMKENVQLIKNKLPSSCRCKIATQEVENLVATAGTSSAVWLAGHSLGAAIALQAGKNMAKKGTLLESFLFNPPYLSPPIEMIKNKIVKRCTQLGISGARFIGAHIKQSKEQRKQSADSFAALSPWVPQVFVNKADHICSGYIGYFEIGKRMRKLRLKWIHKISSRYSLTSQLLCENGTQAEPLHLFPSANLIINLEPPNDFKRAHGILEWLKQDLKLKSEVYKY